MTRLSKVPKDSPTTPGWSNHSSCCFDLCPLNQTFSKSRCNSPPASSSWRVLPPLSLLSAFDPLQRVLATPVDASTLGSLHRQLLTLVSTEPLSVELLKLSFASVLSFVRIEQIDDAVEVGDAILAPLGRPVLSPLGVARRLECV